MTLSPSPQELIDMDTVLEFVPYALRTKTLCLAAVRNNRTDDALRHIPGSIETKP
jgi:hypothetical protein